MLLFVGHVCEEVHNSAHDDLSCSIISDNEHVAIPIEPVSVCGNLRQNATFWRDTLQVSDFILGIVTEGYRLPFIKLPRPSFQDNRVTSVEDKCFVAEAIQELLASGCAVSVDSVPLVCSPLIVVAKEGGKRRLVIDLRHVNNHLHKFRFRYEGLDIAAQLLEKGCWMTTFDLKSGYHHIEIHPDYWSYLGFSWEHGGKRVHYVFRVLPFGLATACYVFILG